MHIKVISHFKLAVSGVLLLSLVLALACGSPAATTTESAPISPITTESAPPSPATEPLASPTATSVPQQPLQTDAGSEKPMTPVINVEEPSVAADAEVKRPTLKVGVIWLSTPLDPVESGWVPSQSGMSETLFRLSASDLGPEPWLATGATQLDPLTWEIRLRSDVLFHNGNIMDAQAVKASLERTVRLSAGSADSLAIENIAVKDEHTIIVTNTEPRPTLPGLLTGPATGVHDTLAAEAAGEGNFIDAGALTGPYIPTYYVMGERLDSVAHDDYWAGRPPLAGIDHIAIPDGNSRELALQAGDIDVAINLSPQGVETIDAQPGVTSHTAGIGTSVAMWWVNFERGTLADPLVRQAVAHAIDRESIAGLVNPPGTGSYADILLPEAVLSCPGVTGPVFDPAMSRELLSQAGYADTDGDGIVEKDGQPLEIVVGGYPQRHQLPVMAETAQAMLADVGIGVEVQITEWATVNEPVWDLFGWFNSVIEAGDPVLNVSKFVGLKANAESSDASNYGHYDNSGLVDIVAEAEQEPVMEERKRIACEALAVINDDIAILPVSHAYMVYGTSDRVTGFEAHPTRYYFLDHRIGLIE